MTTETRTETHGFQTEVKLLLHLMPLVLSMLLPALMLVMPALFVQFVMLVAMVLMVLLMLVLQGFCLWRLEYQDLRH